MAKQSTFVYAYLNARSQPIDRERYETPLQEALKELGLGEVKGGGIWLARNREIKFRGIGLDLSNLEKAIPFVSEFLTRCGAPKGSKLQFEVEGERKEIPFGILEGLAIYITLLNNQHWDTLIHNIYSEINRQLGDRGKIRGYWRGPTEIALYVYGYSVDEMKNLIGPFLSEHPSCAKSRFETIA